MAHRSLKFAAAWLVLAVLGCAQPVQHTEAPLGTPARKPAAAARSAAPATSHGLPDRDWQSFVSQRFGFRVQLPDRTGWVEVPDERWLTLLHRPTRSTLRLRSWRASPRVTKDECQEQVYLWRSELRPVQEVVVEGALGAPQGFDVHVRVDLFAQAAEGRRAVAFAFGAAVRRCYAAYFETGLAELTEAELGARLRLVTEGVLGRVEVMGVEAFAEPAPLP